MGVVCLGFVWIRDGRKDKPSQALLSQTQGDGF